MASLLAVDDAPAPGSPVRRLRVVTWNVHRCRGLDGRTRPDRIASVLAQLRPDVVALQEVLSLEGRRREDDQAGFIAGMLGLDVHHGTNRMIGQARYGNVVLTALPGGPGCNYDLSLDGFERRGLLRVDLDLGSGRVLHVFNAHLGVSHAERRGQGRLLEQSGLFDQGALPGPRVLVGDFNEWTPTIASRLLAARLRRARPTGLRWPWSYPGLLPLVAIDRVYFDGALQLRSHYATRTLGALIASDHVPVVTDFELR
jgi:endonuclease/exonuclease/phosphatase family metal-dependent hydrolase